ncbi:hypothetical protein LP316_13105 [Thalassotalea sp. LPB0316]|uniref:hypothetical protein n=1 Tax=Thalassotalea sp. LPB0316 TaxID=2769490 RepID=UPI001867849F|nr:hypothetical protein [Thalassotalea sp. LPB0316]QOL25223.1 hypothetical protein LP316_13105 [Thalassotalea sp. LPB0316]
MNTLTLGQKSKIIATYTLPVILAWLFLVTNLNERFTIIAQELKPSCAALYRHGQYKIGQCDNYINEKQPTIKQQGNLEDLQQYDEKILQYWQRLIDSEHIDTAALKRVKTSSQSLFHWEIKRETKAIIDVCNQYQDPKVCEIASIYIDVDQKLFNIFIFNITTVFIMVLLPFLMMAEFLAKSQRIHLSYERRKYASTNNWWLKLILGGIMVIGWVYIINPLGRGASTYYQFFISAGMITENTLPIFIKVERISPVVAGFFGWYLHLIGYIFTKVIHHDVISGRVYNLLFKKFIVVYGLSLILPTTGIIENGAAYTLFTFLIGLFPLTTMSMLFEAASKLGMQSNKATGNLSILPGISRWQILRLEEEGVDSMASLANIRRQTIDENLQFIRRLTYFWVDIAQLYTIVGDEGYKVLKEHCQTASEFIKQSENTEFCHRVDQLEGVSNADEIARLLKSTFPPSSANG